MVKNTFLVLMLLYGSYVNGQQTECKVLKAGISDTYEGECKKGLAHGHGIAQGTDRYEGNFIKGFPSGRGTYKWASGVSYEGEWKNGMREGEGKMVYPDSMVTGIWAEDKYQGIKLLQPYRVVTSMSVSRYTITKTADKNDAIKIRLKQGGLDNISIENFSLVYDSGSEYRSGNYYGLENVKFPLSVKVKYRSWNQLMSSQYDVIFEFVITQPGSWDIAIIN
jgi:hypothetical protein